MKPTVITRVKELNVCGWQAVSMLFARHPDEIRRLFFDPATGKRTGEMCRALAMAKKIYPQVPPDELEKVAGTVHHGGIVAVIAERPLKRVMPGVIDEWARNRTPLLLLDRVSNANNLGAIVRTAAFFGVRVVVLPDHPAQALPGEAAWRVAEGGMEFVDFYRVPALPEFCAELKRRFFVIGTSVSGNQLPPGEVKARGLPRPPAVILGNEEKGLAPGVAALCDRLVRIPGADTIESLNVSAAAAVLCWEFFGQRRNPGQRNEHAALGRRGVDFFAAPRGNPAGGRVRGRLGGSGLAALEELQALGVSAVGVDARAVGAGAAGRNGGFVLAGLAGFPDTVRQFGRETAAAIYRATAVEIRRQADDLPGIINLTGSLRIADDAKEAEECRHHLAALNESGFVAEAYRGPEGEGLLIPTDGMMQPLERVRALANRLRERSGRLYEQSPVRKILAGQVVTDSGLVRCDTVIVAVDGGLEKIFPELAPRVRTARLQMLGTAPAPEVNFTRPVYRRQGYDYWQQRPDRTIALGGFRDRAIDREWTHETEPTDYIQGLLEEFLRRQLGVRAAITHRWAASVGYTDDGLPVLEEVRPKVWAVGGYNGTGNIVGALSARAVARLACGEKSEWVELLTKARSGKGKAVG